MIFTLDGYEYDTTKNCCHEINGGSGAEGTVYEIAGGCAVKIYHEFNSEMADKLTDCLEAGAYLAVDHISVPPISLAKNASNKVVGYKMRMLRGYTMVRDLADLHYCQSNGISIKQIGALFYHLHEALSHLHDNGMVVGDFRGANIAFRSEPGEAPDIAIMDVDSWEVSLDDGFRYCTAIHPSVMHPELVGKEDFSGLYSHHDWYAFAHQLATCLIKCDPFAHGTYKNWVSGQRKAKGISCFSGGVAMTDMELGHIKRLGPNLAATLKLWLTGKVTGVFPKQEILDFLLGLTKCRKCKIDIHKGAVNCPYCKTAL